MKMTLIAAATAFVLIATSGVSVAAPLRAAPAAVTAHHDLVAVKANKHAGHHNSHKGGHKGATMRISKFPPFGAE